MASEHNGGGSRVPDTLVHSTLCLFWILIDKGFLRYFTPNNEHLNVNGSLVPMDMFPAHGMVRSRRLVISETERHGAAALISTYNTAKYISSDNYYCVYA